MIDKTTKKEFRYFSIPQWQKEQDYLQKQHREGWRFTGVTFLGIYHFEKCQPEDVVYQLDYNPEGVANKAEYVQMFQDCGWEYLQDFVGYSYFRKPVSMMNGQEEIFCDDDSRMDMMKRVLKGRVLPLVIIFCCIILPQLFMQSHSDSSISGILTGMFAVLFVLYLVLFLIFAFQFWKYWKMLKN